MKLHHFHEAIAIAERGSIRAAARDLQMAQSALTRSLAELERELGAPLFERRARGVVPTPIGDAFVRRAASIMTEVRRTREEVGQLLGASTGTVTVGLSIAAHLQLLPPSLRAFLGRYPDIHLDIIEGLYPTLEGPLRDGGVDFYIGPDPGLGLAPELSRDVLAVSRRTVLGRAGHPLASATSLRELGGAQWITTSVTVAAEDEIGAVFARHGLPPPRLALRSRSALTLMTCLSNSDLLAMAPVQWSEFAPARNVLAAIPVREDLAAAPMVVIKRADLPLTPAATYLLDLLRRGRSPAIGFEKAAR